MKFNAKQVSTGEKAGQWAVFKGNSQFWPHTARADQDEAEALAAIMSAEWHVEQARALIKKVSNVQSIPDGMIKTVGALGNELCDDVVGWCAKFDPEHNEMDPKCWTC